MTGMRDRWNEADFDEISWHDCHIWGLRLVAGDPRTDDWTADLVLDIDYISEWICPAGEPPEFQFQVAPAALTFHGVSNLRIHVEPSHAEAAIHPWSIDGIEREPVEHQQMFLNRIYYRWQIRLNWPADSDLTFNAAGFTQQLKAAPVLATSQHLTRRRPL